MRTDGTFPQLLGSEWVYVLMMDADRLHTVAGGGIGIGPILAVVEADSYGSKVNLGLDRPSPSSHLLVARGHLQEAERRPRLSIG